MWKFLKEFNALAEKPHVDGRKIWASVSRSPEDRKKGNTLSAYKRVLVEVGLTKAEDVDFDSRRGLLWVGKCRVGEWNADCERLELDENEMQAAGVKVDAKILSDEVADAMAAK